MMITPNEMLCPLGVRNNNYSNSTYLRGMDNFEINLLEEEVKDIETMKKLPYIVVTIVGIFMAIFLSIWCTLDNITNSTSSHKYVLICGECIFLSIICAVSFYARKRIKNYSIDTLSDKNCSKTLDNKRINRIKNRINYIREHLGDEIRKGTSPQKENVLRTSLTHFTNILLSHSEANDETIQY